VTSADLSSAAGVVAALAAAMSFGIASVWQHYAAREAPLRRAGRPGLFMDLIRDRRWRWSVPLSALAFAFQVTALKLLPLVVVQPLLLTGLLWYVLVSAALEHRRPDPVMIIATAGCLAGLSALLILAHAAPGTGQEMSLLAALPLGASLAAVVAICLALAATVGSRWRSLPLALAAGVCYGVTAGLVRYLSRYFADGLVAVLGHWQTYVVIVLGVVGVLLSQNAYQAGRLGSPALAVMTVTDPLVSIAVGLIWLGERTRTGTGAVTGQLIALCVLVGSVFLLSQRAPHVRLPTTAHDAKGPRRQPGDRSQRPEPLTDG
jgi:drug/metabolite transporter (DMT)-like permease